MSDAAAGWRTSPVVAAAQVLALGVLPVVLAVVFLRWQHGLDVLGFDFRGTLWQPGKDILDGVTPYPRPSPGAIATGNPAVYPPAVMLLTIPLAVLPWSVAVGIWIGLSLGAAALALWLLGVRDWRCYGVALTTEPLLFGLSYGNVTLFLLLGLAVVWRWRDSPWIVAAAVGAVIVMKLFLWPLLIWLLVSRRVRSAVVAVGLAVVVALGSWAVIGFRGLLDYPRLLRALDEVYAEHTQSLYALGRAAGLGVTPARAIGVLAGLFLLVVAAVVTRRSDGDRRSFCAVVLAAIAITPVAWIYYFAILLVPVALARPRLSWLWTLPLAFWVVPFLPGTALPDARCCAPPGMPDVVWRSLVTEPAAVLLAGHAVLFAFAVVLTVFGARSRPKVA